MSGTNGDDVPTFSKKVRTKRFKLDNDGQVKEYLIKGMDGIARDKWRTEQEKREYYHPQTGKFYRQSLVGMDNITLSLCIIDASTGQNITVEEAGAMPVELQEWALQYCYEFSAMSENARSQIKKAYEESLASGSA